MKTLIAVLLFVLAGCASTPPFVGPPTKEEALQIQYDAFSEPFRTEITAKIEEEGRKLAHTNAESHIKNLSYCAYLRMAQDQEQQADDFIVAMLAYSLAATIEFDSELIDEVTRWNFETNYKDGVEYFRTLTTANFLSDDGKAGRDSWLATCGVFADGGYTIASGIGETQ